MRAENVTSGTPPDHPVKTDIGQLRALLHEERDAIRRLDSASILAAAERKQSLLADLQAHIAAGLGAIVVDALRELMPLLRQNLVLLAHARDCVRDAIDASRGDGLAPVSGRLGQTTIRPGARICIVG